MKENNFLNFTDYDYETNYSCEDSGCDYEGICRCGSIDETRVYSVSVNRIVEDLYDRLQPFTEVAKKRDKQLSYLLGDDSIIDKYCFYRISVKEKLYDASLYKVIVCGGYYGDEIDDVELDKDIFKIWLEKCIVSYYLPTIKEKLDYVLINEYGSLLPELVGKNYELHFIKKDLIDFTDVNQNHVTKVKSKELDFYSDKNYELPRGIVKYLSNGKYRIIDGYHRIISSNSDEVLVYIVV